jgi:pimeloyl-ACP methyl ester carboxylesterase
MLARVSGDRASMRTRPAGGEVLRLRDGRRLGFAERGDPGGAPAFDFHGNPGSRLSFWGDEEVVRSEGVRLIGVDRPGIGLSDPQPGRRVVDWPRDVAELADALGIGSFAVVGHSVGGAYAAACAYAYPERVWAAALVSPIIPLDLPGAIGELGKPTQWRLARSAPWALRALFGGLFLLARTQPRLARRAFEARSGAAEKPLASRPDVVQRALVSAREANRQGPRGLVEDMRVVMRAWGFRPDEIRVPLFVWQGDADSSIPFRWGQWWRSAVPGARLISCPGEGHLLVEERIGEILGTLAAEGARTR